MTEIMNLDPDDAFDMALVKIKELHDRKKEDYSDPNNRYSNFQLASKFSGVPTTKVFEILLGVKQARLMELLSRMVKPKNEPIEDTLLDRAVYAILAYCYYMEYERTTTDGQ